MQLSLRETGGGGPHQESHNGTVEVGPDLECWFNAAGSEELLEKEDILELIKLGHI